jgi:hypothetical protein
MAMDAYSMMVLFPGRLILPINTCGSPHSKSADGLEGVFF